MTSEHEITWPQATDPRAELPTPVETPAPRSAKRAVKAWIVRDLYLLTRQFDRVESLLSKEQRQ